jgi:hypothetical protein
MFQAQLLALICDSGAVDYLSGFVVMLFESEQHCQAWALWRERKNEALARRDTWRRSRRRGPGQHSVGYKPYYHPLAGETHAARDFACCLRLYDRKET